MNRIEKPLNKKVIFTSRLFNENKGGNSRYGKELLKGLVGSEFTVEIKKVSPNKYFSLYQELTLGYVPTNKIIHFLSDTGQIFPLPNPTITTVHGIASLHNFGIRSKSNEYIWRKRVQLALKFSKLIITPSQSSRSDLLKVFDFNPTKIHVIEHGIDHAQFNSLPQKNDLKLLSELKKIPERYVLYIGNLDPRKNLKSLIAAVELKAWPSEIKLVIVGKFAWGDVEMIKQMESNPKIVYLGQLDDRYLPALYRNTELFVFPSLYEGFGFPVLEALACGAPVLTTQRGNLKIFKLPGHPIIEDPLDSTEILNKILQILSSNADRLKFKEEGINLASKYNWNRSVNLHKELYSRVLE